MKLLVNNGKEPSFEVEVNDDATIHDLKKAIATAKKILPKAIRVFDLSKKIATNQQKLADLGFKDNCAVSILITEEPKKKEEGTNFLKIFNSFVKNIKDKSGGEETQTEIIMLVEKPKVQEMLEAFSCNSKMFRQAIDSNSTLQENAALEQCIIETFEMLGATCDPKPEPLTNEALCKLFGIVYSPEFEQQIQSDDVLRESFNEMRSGIQLVGGLEVFQRKPEKRERIDLRKIFASQLQYFEQMGFYDTEKNLRAIEEGGGDFDASVQYLVSHNYYQ